jgi:hypothetical protein
LGTLPNVLSEGQDVRFFYAQIPAEIDL